MAETVKFFNTYVGPAADSGLDLGASSFRWAKLFTTGTTEFNGVTYTWPSADGNANDVLTTNGSATMTWAAAIASFVSVVKWGSITL